MKGGAVWHTRMSKYTRRLRMVPASLNFGLTWTAERNGQHFSWGSDDPAVERVWLYDCQLSSVRRLADEEKCGSFGLNMEIAVLKTSSNPLQEVKGFRARYSYETRKGNMLEFHLRDLYAPGAQPTVIVQTLTKPSVQRALSILIGRVAQGELTHHQFFEGMEAWERCFRRLVPGYDYTAESLVKLAMPPHAF